MSEEKQFKKTRELSLDEVRDLTDEWSTLKVADFPKDTHIVAKIIGEPERNHNEKMDFYINLVPILYSKDGMEAELKVRVGDSCYDRFIEKYKAEEYVGKRAFIKKTEFNGKYPQHIHVIHSEITKKDKDEIFAPKTDAPKVKHIESEITGLEVTDEDREFVKEYKEMVGQIPDDQKEINMFLGTYFRSKWKDNLKPLIEEFTK